MMKKAQVVMLTTEKESRLSQNSTGKLHYEDDPYGQLPNFTPKHLYFVTDDIPKDGDWVIPIDPEYGNRPWKYKPAPCPLPYWGAADNCRKIIATTNPDLWIKQLPNMGEGMGWRPSDIAKISTDFVEAYVREQGKIKEVNLEYERFEYGVENTKDPIHWRPKLRPNGTVIIHPVKEKLYTRQEVINFLLECTGNDVEGVMEFVKYSLPQI